MSRSPKTDYSGLARTGLEIVGNQQNPNNQNLEVPASCGDIRTSEQFGHVKNPHVDFKITADFKLNGTGTTAAQKVALGKVHGTGTVPYALKTLSASCGAGEEPTFGVDLVQIQAGAKTARCVYVIDEEDFSPARHAHPWGAFEFEESDDLTLQHADMSYDCDLDPTKIEGMPKASDCVKGKKTVNVTMWSTSDTDEPEVEIAEGFKQTGDWGCTGSDGQMFVWTATFTKYLESVAGSTVVQAPSTAPNPSQNQST